MKSSNGKISFLVEKSFSKGKQVRMKISPHRGKLVELFFNLVTEVNGYSLVEVIPLTGRTHQIRVAFQALNLPIYNDQLYGSPVVDDDNFGQYLHAYSLTFKLGNEMFSFTAELPITFIKKMSSVGMAEIKIPS